LYYNLRYLRTIVYLHVQFYKFIKKLVTTLILLNCQAVLFRSAYKKLVIRQNNIKHFNTVNCLPLDHIDILHYSSSDPIKVISNSSNNNYDLVDSEEDSRIILNITYLL
jgi:hypothetical protein